MKLRIVCFEDNPKDWKRLEHIFTKHEVEFLPFVNPSDWDVTPGQIEGIAQFKPDFAIVDLKDDKRRVTDAGERLIRKLKESKKTRAIPIVVWSVLLRNTGSGLALKKRIEELDATPLFKNRKNLPGAYKFLRAAGLNE
ncbi:MAG: hypothetical protein QOE77_819 [Blastocatellia bacterium]|jgi:hypothetical protein|nr:hypothetical protein [Blastocatellia bacterium]